MQNENEVKNVTLKDRFRKHKKIIIGGTMVIGGVIAAYLYKDYLIKKLFDNIDEIPLDTAISVVPEKMTEEALKVIDVSLHQRKLPIGRHPSKEKIVEALKLGIDLMPGYTLVDRYQKSIPA